MPSVWHTVDINTSPIQGSQVATAGEKGGCVRREKERRERYMEESQGEGVNSDSETCFPTALAGISSLHRPPCQSCLGSSRSPSPARGEASSTITILEQGCKGLKQTGKGTGQSLGAYDQGERSKDGCGSCNVNPAILRRWLPSCFLGWKMTQGSLEQSHPAPVRPGNQPNPT